MHNSAWIPLGLAAQYILLSLLILTADNFGLKVTFAPQFAIATSLHLQSGQTVPNTAVYFKKKSKERSKSSNPPLDYIVPVCTENVSAKLMNCKYKPNVLRLIYACDNGAEIMLLAECITLHRRTFHLSALKRSCCLNRAIYYYCVFLLLLNFLHPANVLQSSKTHIHLLSFVHRLHKDRYWCKYTAWSFNKTKPSWHVCHTDGKESHSHRVSQSFKDHLMSTRTVR